MNNDSTYTKKILCIKNKKIIDKRRRSTNTVNNVNVPYYCQICWVKRW